MSRSRSDAEQPGALARVSRTVSPPFAPREDAEMDVFGWTMFLVLLALFVPFLPFVAVVWFVSKALEAVTGRRN